MPSILAFLTAADLPVLLQRLNDDPDVAFLVADGPRRWHALETVPSLASGHHLLWHVPSGRLPLLKRHGPPIVAPPGEIVIVDPPRPAFVEDPWSGWDEEVGGWDRSVPHFGAGHFGIIDLDLRIGSDTVAMTSFGWIGSRYKKAPPETGSWWKAFGRWFKKVARKVNRAGKPGGRDAEVWAFPDALRAIEGGMRCEGNPLGVGAAPGASPTLGRGFSPGPDIGPVTAKNTPDAINRLRALRKPPPDRA